MRWAVAGQFGLGNVSVGDVMFSALAVIGRKKNRTLRA